MRAVDAKNLQVGHVLAIPFEADSIAAAKVVYVSEYFKSVIGLRLMNCLFQREPKPEDLRGTISYLDDILYTGRQPVGKYWRVVAKLDVSADEIDLTRRLVAGDIYVGDQNLGKATETDRRTLRSMGVLGMYAVHEDLAHRLKKRPPAARDR